MDCVGKMARRFVNIFKRFMLPYAYAEKQISARIMRTNANLYLPNFLGIGAQKASTSWLYENLRCHPELYLPESKELHYFDWNFFQSLRFYSAEFEPGCHKVKGEITPGYSTLSLGRIRLIRALMPDVRLIFLMRNPIDRAFSQALMNLVNLPNREFKEVDESEFYSHFTAKRSVKRGNYLTILDNWLSVFPHAQLYVGSFEDIANCPQKLLGEVFAHIGVSQEVDWSSFPYRRVINKNPGISAPQVQRFFTRDVLPGHRKFIRAFWGSSCHVAL